MDFSKERSINYLRGAAQALYDETVRLREENARLRAQLGDAAATGAAVEAENALLQEMVARQRHALFGRSTERRPHPSKPEKAKGPQVTQVGHGPREQPELERVTVRHELPADERACPGCGGHLTEMAGQTESSELVSVTETAYVLETHEQQKYRCACNGAVVTAPGPKRLVPGGRYSPAFAVEVAIAKYADHLPLERQAHIMKRDGLRIDSQTLWDQLDLLADHLAGSYEAIIADILRQPVIHADETRWPLLANGHTKENKLFQAWGIVSPDAVAYRILDSRSTEAAAKVLGGYKGTVMADAYTVYQSLGAAEGFAVANCWAHVRRKFVECQPNFPVESLAALDLIGKLYDVEREAREATAETRRALRQERSKAIVEKLFAWA